MNKSGKTRILVVGPLPPPYGGYAHVVSSVLRPPFTETFDLISYDTKLRDRIERGSIFAVMIRAAKNIAGFAHARTISQPDVALLFTGLSGCFWPDLFLMYQCHRAKLPIIVRFFGGDVHLRMGRLPIALKRLAVKQLSKAKALLVETQATVQYFKQLIPEVPIHRVPNFIHMEDAFVSTSDCPMLSQNGVFFLGTLTPTKGVEIILSSIDKVCDYRRVPFHFVGGEAEPGYLEHFRTLASRLRHSEAVKVHGYLPRSEAHAVARECRIFAFPPPWPEGQPAALVEAMAMGLVPVASRWGGIPEIIQHRVNGLLMETLTPDTLACSIIELLQDSNLLKQLSVEARETIRTNYEAHVALEQYQKIVTEARSHPSACDVVFSPSRSRGIRE